MDRVCWMVKVIETWLYDLIVFKRISDGKIVRKIPVKKLAKSAKEDSKWIQKNVIWDTKNFKFKGNRIFLTLKSDTTTHGLGWFVNEDYKKIKKAYSMADDSMHAIICQGFEEGWYKPREVMIIHTLISRKVFYDKYQKYNYTEEQSK